MIQFKALRSAALKTSNRDGAFLDRPPSSARALQTTNSL
jgi:hypothetical protein